MQWIHSPFPVAHPLDNGAAVILERSVEATALRLGKDMRAYLTLMKPLVRDWPYLEQDLLGPLRLPRYPTCLGRFGWRALRSAQGAAKTFFRHAPARALFAGLSAHSMLSLERIPSAAFGLILAIAGHAVGWPVPRGGATSITHSLGAYFRSLGGTIQTGMHVRSLNELPPARIIHCDVTPRQLLSLAGNRLPRAYQRLLRRYQYGFGVYKMDWALDGPIPWLSSECLGAATVHLGGNLEEIALSERSCSLGQTAASPFVLLAQQSLFDSTRAPQGKHCVWAYCHVPNGSTLDMTASIEAQIERFAPGFKKRILARCTLAPRDLEGQNPNLVGGDINGGAPTLRQIFFRPTLRNYRTPARGLYLCSSSTPPGGGVHGMCGYFAARTALADDAARTG